jgi:phosphohistidine swiveling domain-containing protein
VVRRVVGADIGPVGMGLQKDRVGNEMKYTRWFQEIGAGDVDTVGGKGANLGEMVAAGLPVPPGFCLTAAAYRDFVQAAGLDVTIGTILSETRPEDPASVETQAARIRELITTQPVPDLIAQETLHAYHRLGQDLGVGDVSRMPVAVRSSATAEDLPTASFAGQQDTYLNVRGESDLLDRVRDCWASLWTDRAVIYRNRQGFDHEKVYLAVVIQAMIPAEVSGILFTSNPISGDPGEVVINASWGLGEAIVSGLVTPDTLTVRKRDGRVVSQLIGGKECIIEYAQDGGTVELATPAKKREIPALSDEGVSELVALAQGIEAHYGTPQDIEWAHAGGRFYLLQSRPITTLSPPVEGADPEVEYIRTFVELFPDPLSPVLLDSIRPLFRSMLDFTLTSWGFEPPAAMEATGGFYNQFYWNRNYIEAAFAPLTPPVREGLVSGFVNPFGRQSRGLHGELSLPFLEMIARLLRLLVVFPDLLPELVAKHQAQVAESLALALADLPDREILAEIRSLVFGTTSKLLDSDFLMIAFVGITYQMLGSLLERYFGEDTEELRGKLISGVTGNVAMESNKQLWDLAQLAKAEPAVDHLVRRYEGADLIAHLERAPEAKPFLEALERFLSEYGHREIRMDIIYPTWGEDPTPVLGFVRSYLDVREAQSPHHQQARLVKEREELTQSVLARVEKDIMGRLLFSPILRWVLKHAQANTRERDTVHFELTRLFPPFRRMLSELGHRWNERGLVADPDDMFYLTLDEMDEVAASPRPMFETVQARRAEYELNKSRPWPDIIRGGRGIFAEAAGPVEAIGGQLHGVAGSPGLVTGVARVIHGPEEFSRLQKNDILVAPLTNPAWTPLFAVAGAVITEVGGILSHGAIVAREYGIPAVLSVAGVMSQVSDGQTITVDGNRGIVGLEMGEAA